MRLRNSTRLDLDRLESTFRRCSADWPLDGLLVLVRYARSSAFSGTCRYSNATITINLGRRNDYPFPLKTCIGRPETLTIRGVRYWRRPVCVVPLRDAYELALFLFMHELYHWLVRRAGRNTRQKEGRCDRFAVRALVDQLQCVVLDDAGQPVPRESWDFQDLDGFVASARKAPRALTN